MENGIYADDLVKRFGKRTVVDGVSLAVPPGRALGVVGANGSGKTVLMKCICGFMKPDEGSVRVNGAAIGRERDFPPRCGVIIETPGFIPGMSGLANLRLLAAIGGGAGKQQVTEAIERVGLADAMKKKVSKYSLGMRQRLGIAQAIMESPDVLILDEPFNALDASSVVMMRNLLVEMKNNGCAILLASHNADDISFICDDVLEMKVTE